MGKAEGLVQFYLMDAIVALGGGSRKVKWENRVGAPDLLMAHPKLQPWMVETKAPDGRLAAVQIAEHKRLTDMGIKVDIVWDLELAKEYMHLIEQEIKAAG